VNTPPDVVVGSSCVINARGLLDVGDGHRVYWEDWGTPDGVPVLFLHGGPGDSFRADHQALFDPEQHRVLFFDQRGCGRSTPFASTDHNTTGHLLADIDRLLDHVGMDTAHVCGGSWGSALSLLYALHRPARVRSLLVWGVYLIRQFEDDWVNEGHPRHMLPAEWERFIALVPDEHRSDGDAIMDHYARKMRSPDQAEATRYAFEWTLWESTLESIAYDPDALEAALSEDPNTLSTALLETHYFTHGCFVPANFILDNVHTLRDIPCQIIQGRFDLCTPAVTAYDLQRAYGDNAVLRFVNAGHSVSDPLLSGALRQAAAALGRN
jgi:proline iminopeptidase